jgi:predicted RNase H-like nuclease (RuvC/YqgF family)
MGLLSFFSKEDRNFALSVTAAMCVFKEQIKELQEKVEILENETKTQDDIIFDMRKKIEKLEKSSWKGKNK